MKTGFEIPRKHDRVVWGAVFDAIEGQSVSKKTCHTILGVDHIDPSPNELAAILDLNTIALLRFRIDLSNGIIIKFARPSSGDQVVTGLLDSVNVECNDAAKSVECLTVIRDLRDALGAVDSKTHLDYLSEGDRDLALKRDEILNTLAEVQENFFREITAFTVNEANRWEEKRSQLDIDIEKRRQKLEDEYSSKLGQIENRESELDARSATVARRELRKDLKKIIQERSQGSEVTWQTKGRRWLVFAVYVLLLFFFGWGTVTPTPLIHTSGVPLELVDVGTPNAMNLEEAIKDGKLETYWPNIVRQSAFGLAFAVTAGFFLRWLNRWAQVHADEEFRLKRLELDVDRASWLVEMMYEWKDEKGSAMPAELVKMLGANLFVDQSNSDHAMTAADALGSALVESASQAKLKVGENELLLKRGGIRRLAKKAIEGGDEE